MDYLRINETFVLDDKCRTFATLNPTASSRMANRLLEATDRQYWTPMAILLCRTADALEIVWKGFPHNDYTGPEETRRWHH